MMKHLALSAARLLSFDSRSARRAMPFERRFGALLLGALVAPLSTACSDSAPADSPPLGGSGGAGASTADGAGGGGQVGGSSGAGGAAGPLTSAGAGGDAGAAAGSAGAGGAGSGGSGGTGGASAEPTDCNGVVDQPVITVARDGSADFTTVQAAIDSISRSNTTPTQIRIAEGMYREKLRIDRPNITLCGPTGKASSTVLTYGDNANTPNGSGGTLGTTGSASTNISSNDVSAENITFANSTPLGGTQAVALLVTGDQVQFRSCRFTSYQDTLYVRKGKQYFKDCYVEGSVDYIFGDATAVFDQCTIHSAAGGVAVTAPSTEPSVEYGLVFLGGELTRASGVADNSVTLGRNWRPYGAAAYLRTKLGPHIKPVGWMAMGDNTLATARFSEYQTSGEGASASDIAARVPQSKQLSDEQAARYTLATILGSWVPSFSE